ncbi:MAG: ATP-binding protein [Candidatus Sericytochromatia bacterium]
MILWNIIFQKLHTKNEYSGTGIGLTICKKIINQCGGNIWLKPIENQGSTFHFTKQNNLLSNKSLI